MRMSRNMGERITATSKEVSQAFLQRHLVSVGRRNADRYFLEYPLPNDEVSLQLDFFNGEIIWTNLMIISKSKIDSV